MLSCQQYDYIEIACMYHYPVKLTMKSGTIVQAKALDTARNEDRQECIKVLIDENEKLIIAFSHIVNNINKDIKLVFIGNGQEKINLIELVSSLRLENRVLFKGKITDTDALKNYYKLAIASVSFGQAGLSVLQSLGYGVPFITKKNAVSGGEIFNIVDTHNGILCEDSIISLEDSLKEVCNNIEKSKLMGEKAYIYYNQYCTIQNMVQGFVNAIECKENKNEF